MTLAVNRSHSIIRGVDGALGLKRGEEAQKGPGSPCKSEAQRADRTIRQVPFTFSARLLTLSLL